MKRLPLAAMLAGLALATAAAAMSVRPMIEGVRGSGTTGLRLPQPMMLEPGKRLPDGSIGPGDVFSDTPFSFERTGVLTEDLTASSIFPRGVLAPAGSPAIYLGRAGMDFSRGGMVVRNFATDGEFWCFLPSRAGGKRESLCLAVFARGAAIGPDNANPYMFLGFTPSSGTPNWSHLPKIKEGPIQLGNDARILYSFVGWTRDGAKIEIWVGMRRFAALPVKAGSDGAVIVETPSGNFRLEHVSGNAQQALLTLIP